MADESVDNLRAVVIAWLKDKQSDITQYITKEGLALLNGYMVSKDYINLVDMSKYTKLQKDYEDLVNKYIKLKKDHENLRTKRKKSFFNLFN